MADISVGGGKYLFHINGGIQGIAGHPFAHKKGKNIVCQTDQDPQPLERDNACLCSYPAVQVFRTFCYLDDAEIPVYTKNICSAQQGEEQQAGDGDISIQTQGGVQWKWCGWYQKVGCQSMPSGVWTNPGFTGHSETVVMKSLCSPRFFGSISYTHAVQQMLVTNYKCCVTQGGLNGCCKQVDDSNSLSQGLEKCVCQWSISRDKPNTPWGDWVFVKKIGCVGQNAYLNLKNGLAAKIWLNDCYSGGGYAITRCGTCDDQGITGYKHWPPSFKPETDTCLYWGLYFASYVQQGSDCGWTAWEKYTWPSQDINAPDPKLVKGIDGWGPVKTLRTETRDGRKAGVDIFQCKKKRVWHWRVFKNEQQCTNYDPADMKRLSSRKCSTCQQGRENDDHMPHLSRSDSFLKPGEGGSPCVAPILPRSVFQEDPTCYDLWRYQLQVDNGSEGGEHNNVITCIKTFKYARDEDNNKKRKKILDSVTQWRLLSAYIDGYLVMDNINRVLHETGLNQDQDQGSWFYLRPVPCGQNPDQWDDDDGADNLPPDKRVVDTCIRVFSAGAKCVKNQQTGLKHVVIQSGSCGKWAKVGKFTEQQIKQSANGNGLDMTKTNTWQKAPPGSPYQMIYLKTSRIRDQLCDKYPDAPDSVHWRARVIQLQYKCCSDSQCSKTGGKGHLVWPDQAFCISDSTSFCSPEYPKLYGIYADRELKDQLQFARARQHSQWSFQVSQEPIVPIILVPDCKAYMCISMQTQSGPLSSDSFCDTSFEKTDEIGQAASRLVFSGCNLEYSVYKLWQASGGPCACFQKSDCNPWSPVYRLGSQQQISVCTCNQQYAIQLIKYYISQFTQGQQVGSDSPDNEYAILLSKLSVGQVIPIKVKRYDISGGYASDFSYFWFYLSKQQIQKPSRYVGPDKVPWQNHQLQQMWQGNPCFFAKSQSKLPEIDQPQGLYVGYINKLIPYCFTQSDSSDPGHPKGTRWVGTKLAQQFPKCKCGDFQWCSEDGLPVPGYYMDQDLSQACLSRLDKSGNLILVPGSDARQIYHFSIEKTQMNIQGFDNQLSQDPDECSCSKITLNEDIVKNMRIQWGGSQPWNIQASLQCCPIYRYRYIKTYKVVSIPGVPGDRRYGGHGFQLCIQAVSQSSGYMSFQGEGYDIKGERQWKQPDIGRDTIWGQPVCISESDPAWDSDCVSGADSLKFQISFTLRNTPSLAAKGQKTSPWDFFKKLSASPSALSKYKIKATGHLSYIIGQGPQFQWDIENAKLQCVQPGGIQFLSAWDSSDCNPEGHQFTYYTQSCFQYTQIPDQQGNAKHISPMQLQIGVNPPKEPLALWHATRQYSKDEQGNYQYSDSWGGVQSAQLTCQSDCSWTGQQCQLTWQLNYTQPLAEKYAPHPPYGEACFNVAGNMPSFSDCSCWKCTRTYRVVQCPNERGKHMLAYSDSWCQASQNQGSAEEDGGTWTPAGCGVLQLTWCHGTTIPSGPPQSLPGCNCPVPADLIPQYLKRSKNIAWRYTRKDGLLALDDSDTFQFACQQGQQGQCQCSQDTVTCTASVPFESGGVCTADPSITPKQPWAQFTKLVTFYQQAQGGVCYSATDWTFNNLVCSQQSNQSQCTDPRTQTMYGYTRLPYSAAIISSFNQISVAPRYWKHQFVYAGHDANGNRSGTWSVHGPQCASDGTSGWNSLLCDTNYGQVFTQWSTDCTLQSGLPQTDLWPYDVYTRWQGRLSPTEEEVGWCYDTYNNISWTSQLVCQSSAASVVCNGGDIVIVEYNNSSQHPEVSPDILGSVQLYGIGYYTISYTIDSSGILSSSYTFSRGGVSCGSAPQTSWTSQSCDVYECTYVAPLRGSCIAVSHVMLPSNTYSMYAHITYFASAVGSCIPNTMEVENVQLVCSSGGSVLTCTQSGIRKQLYKEVNPDNAYPITTGGNLHILQDLQIAQAGLVAEWQYTLTYQPKSSGSWSFVGFQCSSGTNGWATSQCSLQNTFSCYTFNKTSRAGAYCFVAPSGSPIQARYTNFQPPAPQYKYVWTYSGYTSSGGSKQRYGTWSSAGLECPSSGASGWDTMECRPEYGQKYTSFSTNSNVPYIKPQPSAWPADPYIKWTASISPNGAHCISPGNWSSQYVCSSGAASTTCTGGEVTVTVYTDITDSPSQESINTAVGSVGLRGLYVYTQEYKSTGIHASWNLLSIGCGINSSGWDSLSCNLDSHVFYYTVDFVNSGGTMCLPDKPTQSPVEAGYTNQSPTVPNVVCAATYGLSRCRDNANSPASCVSRTTVYLLNTNTQLTCVSASSGWQQPYTCSAAHVYNYIYTVGGSAQISSSMIPDGNIIFSQGAMVCVQSQTWAYAAGQQRPYLVSSSLTSRCQGTFNSGTSYYQNDSGCYTSVSLVRSCPWGSNSYNGSRWCNCTSITSTYFKQQKQTCFGTNQPCKATQILQQTTYIDPASTTGRVSITIPCTGTCTVVVKAERNSIMCTGDADVTVTLGGGSIINTHLNYGTPAASWSGSCTQGRSVTAIATNKGTGCTLNLSLIVTISPASRSAAAPVYASALAALDIQNTPDVYQQAREQLNIEGD